MSIVKVQIAENAEIERYVSDDGFGNVLDFRKGEIVVVSKEKAEQMQRDFPQWFKMGKFDNVVTTDNNEAEGMADGKIAASPQDKMVKPARVGKKRGGVR